MKDCHSHVAPSPLSHPIAFPVSLAEEGMGKTGQYQDLPCTCTLTMLQWTAFTLYNFA